MPEPRPVPGPCPSCGAPVGAPCAAYCDAVRAPLKPLPVQTVPHEGMYCPLGKRYGPFTVVVDPGADEQVYGFSDEFFDLLAVIYSRS